MARGYKGAFTGKRLGVAGGLAAILCVAAPSIASANYYGQAVLRGGYFDGDIMTIRSNTLTVPNLSTDFVNNDNWVAEDGNYWVEAGISAGNAWGHVTWQPTFFWADQRPNGGFHIWFGTTASLNTSYTDKISNAGSCSYRVGVGSLGGTSTNNCMAPNNVTTGTETTTKSARACSSQSNLGWQDLNGAWHSGWSDGTGNAGRQTDNPPYAYWVSPQSWLRDYANTSC